MRMLCDRNPQVMHTDPSIAQNQARLPAVRLWGLADVMAHQAGRDDLGFPAVRMHDARRSTTQNAPPDHTRALIMHTDAPETDSCLYR